MDLDGRKDIHYMSDIPSADNPTSTSIVEDYIKKNAVPI